MKTLIFKPGQCYYLTTTQTSFKHLPHRVVLLHNWYRMTVSDFLFPYGSWKTNFKCGQCQFFLPNPWWLVWRNPLHNVTSILCQSETLYFTSVYLRWKLCWNAWNERRCSIVATVLYEPRTLRSHLVAQGWKGFCEMEYPHPITVGDQAVGAGTSFRVSFK